MRILRGIPRGTKLTAYILLAFGTVTILTLTGSRSTYAESPSLLGMVRCLVRTVLWVECPSPTPPVQTPTSSPQAPASSESAQTPAGTTVTPSPKSIPVKGEQIELPEEMSAPYETIEPVPEVYTATPRLHEGEYVAYFNRYSPYAVAGMQDTQAAPIQQTTEGWRVLGVAWYWWAAVILFIITIIASVKRRNLRKSSVLSEVA